MIKCFAITLLCWCVIFPARALASAAPHRETSADLSAGLPEEGTPAWLVHMFFVEPSPPDLEPHYDGEMLARFGDDPTWGSLKDDEVTVTYRELAKDSSRALFAVFARTPLGGTDIYCYLHLTATGWKLSAMRSLALRGYIREEGKHTVPLGPILDSLADQPSDMKLILASDSVLRAHFLANRDIFDRILEVGDLRDRSDSLPLTDSRRLEGDYLARLDSLNAELGRLARSVAASAVSGRRQTCARQITVMLGGILDNTVGYVYIPEGCDLPDIWSSYEQGGSGVIYIEEIASRWYVFKTT